MDQVWKGLSNLDPHDPGGFDKKPPLRPHFHALSAVPLDPHFSMFQFFKIPFQQKSQILQNLLL